MTRRKTRALMAFGATLVMLIAACGTRLDDDTIARVGVGTGAANDAPTGTGERLPGEETLPDGEGAPASDDVADGGAADGQPGTVADSRSAGAEGDQGGTRSGREGNRVSGEDSQAKPSGEAVVIGSVGTYSGPVGVAFRDVPRALQAWAAAINAKGGLGGRPVKVIVYDDGGDSSKARSHIRNLVEQQKAVAMVASQANAQIVKAWKPYVEEQRFPVIAQCDAFAHSSPMIFSPCPTLADAAYGTALLGARHGKGKKFGALFCTESDDCAFVDDLWFAKGQAKKAGLEPVYRAKISITQPDFTSECIQARNAGVELLAVIGDPNTVGRVASSCRRQNYNPQYLQPDVTIDLETAGKPGLDDALAVTRVFPFTGLSTPAAREFEAVWTKYGGGRGASGGAAQGWASAKIFEKVARGAGNDLGREALIKQLRRVAGDRFGGLTVPLTYTSNGSRPASCMFLMQASGGRWTAPKSDKPICF